MAALDSLLAGVKQFLAELTDDEFAAVVAEVREPKPDQKQQPQQQGGAPIALNDDKALARIIGAHLSGNL